jgi:hypothetical protein
MEIRQGSSKGKFLLLIISVMFFAMVSIVSACYGCCSDDLDCGDPYCSGEPNYCLDGNVYQDYVFPEFIDIGCFSFCSYDFIAPKLIEECEYGCEDGECIDEPVCVEDRQFGCWSGWENSGVCDEGWMNQTRTRLEYDANVCGTFEDVIHTDYKSIECEMPCVPEIVNSSWGSWIGGECVDNLETQTRTRTIFDANSCGDFDNVTYSESRDVQCEMPCVPDVVMTVWTVWENATECSANGTLVQTRTRFESDVNNCGTFEEIEHEETREIYCSTPECCDDDDCELDYYSDRYCIGDDAYNDFYDYSCDDGSCVFDVTPEFIKTCDDYCDDGYCKREKWDGDKRHNSTQFEKFEAVNYYVNQGTPNESSNVIGLGSGESESSFDWLTFLPWLIVFLILLLLVLIIRFI